jgi:hypothetical protein
LKSHHQERRAGSRGNPPRLMHSGWFLKGPVPLGWLAAAAKLPGRALHVGIVIWFRSGLTGGSPVRLSQAHVAPFGIDRYAKRRAMVELEAAKLISVRRALGRSPVVTLLPGPGAE